MTKKGRQFFDEKNRRHHQLPPRVTPTLVTPLQPDAVVYFQLSEPVF